MRLRHGSAEEAYGPSSHHNDRLAGQDLRLLDNVDGHGERLNQRALLQRHVVWQLIAKVRRSYPQPGQGAVVWRRRGEDHVRAEIVLASAAERAASARITGLEGNTVAGLEMLDGRADLDDGAGGLVAENHWVLDNEVADGTVDPVVDI